MSGQVVLRIAGSMPAAVASAVARHARQVRVETGAAPITTLSNLYGGMGMTSSTGYAYGVGILSGGGGSCSAGTFRSSYQPIGEILDAHGLVLHPA